MLLDEFVQRFFHGEDGTLIAAFHPFENAADFETRLEDHLRKLIQDRLQKLGISLANREAVVRPTWTEGSPFRGLQVFEFQHHAIFFGRTRAIGEILERLKRQAAEGRAFLLVLGVSGCGKSSLVRAGVLPDLVQPGVVEGVGLWRRAILRPGERSGDLFDGLAAALRRDEALPELASDGTTVEQLAGMLRSNPEAAPYLIKGALAQAASHLVKAESSPVQPAARLVLVLDQLEELFTAERSLAGPPHGLLPRDSRPGPERPDVGHRHPAERLLSPLRGDPRTRGLEGGFWAIRRAAARRRGDCPTGAASDVRGRLAVRIGGFADWPAAGRSAARCGGGKPRQPAAVGVHAG